MTNPMVAMLDKLISEAPQGALEAQIRFKDGYGVAGAIKKSPLEGVYQCLAIGQAGKERVPVMVYFNPEDVSTIGQSFEVAVPSNSRLVTP